MDELKLVTELPTRNAMWTEPLPNEMSSNGSMWLAADGFFYSITRRRGIVCSKHFVTPTFFLQDLGVV